jgi:hypothetical protein
MPRPNIVPYVNQTTYMANTSLPFVSIHLRATGSPSRLTEKHPHDLLPKTASLRKRGLPMLYTLLMGLREWCKIEGSKSDHKATFAVYDYSRTHDLAALPPQTTCLPSRHVHLSASSPWCIAADPTGKFVYVANKGDNNVSAYTIGPSSGELTAVDGSPFPAGSGPYSVAVGPTGKFLFITNAMCTDPDVIQDDIV